MCSRVLFVLLSTFTVLAGASVTCDLTQKPSTWAQVHAKNIFFNAYEPDNYFSLNGFCVNVGSKLENTSV